MKTACVTGSHGFVGRRFVRHLLDDGWRVLAVDDMSAGIEVVKWAYPPKSSLDLEIYYMPMRRFLEEDPMRGQQYNLVIHCAAVVGGRKTIDGDPLAVAQNLAIDSDFFRWAVRAKPKKVVYFSSSAVYPVELQTQTRQCKLAEAFVTFANTTRLGLPDQTYGWGKLTGEYLAGLAARQYGLDVVIYRPFSGYGEDQSLDYPFPSIVQRVGRRESPIKVWGSGQQTRDFVHIDDIVDCVLVTMNQLCAGEVLNIGSGQGTSMSDLVTIAGMTVGHIATAQTVPDTPEGVFARVADTYRMERLWKPAVSLREGIRRTHEHQHAAGLLDVPVYVV